MKGYLFRSHLSVTGYATVGTRPDAAFAYKTLVSFNDCHGPSHRDALEDFIGYLAVTAETHMLKLSKGGGDCVVAYCDADSNGTECHQSTTGWIIFHGDNPISWASHTQKCTARLTGEAEAWDAGGLQPSQASVRKQSMSRCLSNLWTRNLAWYRCSPTKGPMRILAV